MPSYRNIVVEQQTHHRLMQLKLDTDAHSLDEVITGLLDFRERIRPLREVIAK